MGPRSKVACLPKAVKEWIDKALVEGNFAEYELLSSELRAQGHDISKSSLHRYGTQFEKRMAAIKIATEQAKAIGDAVPDDENAMGDALIRMIQEKTFSMLMKLEEDPKIGFAKLAGIAIDSGFSSTNVKEFRNKVKSRAKETATEVAATVKQAGLSDEAVAEIKRKILGIVEK